MFLNVLWLWVPSKSGLPVLLLSDVTVSDAAEFSVSQQTDLLLIFGAKDCRANWITNNSFQVKFCFISYSLKFLKHIFSLLFKKFVQIRRDYSYYVFSDNCVWRNKNSRNLVRMQKTHDLVVLPNNNFLHGLVVFNRMSLSHVNSAWMVLWICLPFNF